MLGCTVPVLAESFKNTCLIHDRSRPMEMEAAVLLLKAVLVDTVERECLVTSPGNLA